MTTASKTGKLTRAQEHFVKRSQTEHPACARAVIVCVDRTDHKVILVPVTCHKWACPICGPAKVADAKRLAILGLPERHIVLTCRPLPGLTFAEQARITLAAFRKLVLKARKTWGPFEYMCALEKHKNGAPHLHVLHRGVYLSQLWLARTWRQLTGNYIVHIKRVQASASAADEMAKYLTKTAAALTTEAKNVHLLRHSHGWTLGGVDADIAIRDHDVDIYHRLIRWGNVREAADRLGIELRRCPGPWPRYILVWPNQPPEDQLDVLCDAMPYDLALTASMLRTAIDNSTIGYLAA